MLQEQTNESAQTIPQAKNISETLKNNQVIITDLNTIQEETEKLPHLRPRLKKLIEDVLRGVPRVEAHKNAQFAGKNDAARAQAVADYLQKDYVKKYVDIREKQINEDFRRTANVSKEWVLEKLKATIEACRVDKKHRDLVAAVNSINAMLGYNAAQVIESVSTQKLDTSKLTPDEIVDLSNRLRNVFKAGSVPAVEKGHNSNKVLKADFSKKPAIVEVKTTENDENSKTAFQCPLESKHSGHI